MQTHKLNAELEYQNEEVIAFRVYGKSNSLLLESDYPVAKKSNRKNAVNWRIIEGKMSSTGLAEAHLVKQIYDALESFMRVEFL